MDKKKTNSDKEKILWVLVAVLIVALFGGIIIVKNMKSSFKFISVGEHKITNLEYEYYYNNAYANYMNMYGQYASLFGLDTSKPLSSQIYDGELTWDDYFMEQAVNNIKQVYAMYDAAAAQEGFDMDVKAELQEQIDDLTESLSSSKSTLSSFLKSSYGDKMTVEKYKTFATYQLVATKYYKYLKEQHNPTDEEIAKEYEENIASYSMITFRAESFKYTYEKDATDEDKEKAKNEAKKKAEEQLKDMTKVDLISNYNPSSLTSVLKTWLMDKSRKENDMIVLEDSASQCYYAVEFISLVRNDFGTVDCRQIMFAASDKVPVKVAHKKAETTLEFWEKSGTGEEGFVELANKVSDDTVADGLYEDIYYGEMLEEINDWLFDENRKAGDCKIVDSDNGSHILYFKEKDSEPYWKTAAIEALKTKAATDKQSELAEAIKVKASDGKLPYLTRKTSEELKATSTDAK